MIFYEFFNLFLSLEGKSILRVVILLISSMFITAFLAGKAQALGKYKEIFFGSFLSFLGLLTFVLLGFFINNAILLAIGLLIANIVEGILFYYYVYHSKLRRKVIT